LPGRFCRYIVIRMNSIKFNPSVRFLIPAILLVIGLTGCNGTVPTNGTDQTHQLRAILTADYNRPWTLMAADYRRDNARRSSADITLDTFVLQFARPLFPIDSVFSIAAISARTFTSGSHKLRIVDSTVFTDSLVTTIPDSFAITGVNPSNRVLQGLDQASIQWSGATRVETYVIAAVLRTAAYTGTGYSAYASSLNTAGTFPPEAFSLSPGPAPDTGWYYLYVYAVTGSPDSAYSRHVLPTALPSQLADNITETHFGGRYGSVVIARRDSMHVVQQP